MIKRNEVVVEETQADDVEITEFIPDEAPDRVNIRLDPIFDDVKVKVFHRRHHHLLRSPRRQQQRHSKKVLSDDKATGDGKQKKGNKSKTQDDKGDRKMESSTSKGGTDQLTSTDITFSSQMRLQGI
uniref:Uncharacterized protein n=1 Tax=Setaria digitata TaxID=48799 RepID=A0A915Q7I6_9BILA